MHLDTKMFDCVGDVDSHGWLSVTSLEDTGRFIIDVALDEDMANRRVSITGSRVTPKSIAEILSRVIGESFTMNCVDTIENAQRLALSKDIDHGAAFLMYIRSNFASGNFQLGFEAPFLVDTQARYGWTPESFEITAAKVLGEHNTIKNA